MQHPVYVTNLSANVFDPLAVPGDRDDVAASLTARQFDRLLIEVVAQLCAPLG